MARGTFNSWRRLYRPPNMRPKATFPKGSTPSGRRKRPGRRRSSPRASPRCPRAKSASRRGATRRPGSRDAQRRKARLPAGPRPPRRVPVHARRAADDVPRPPLDDAHVRRLRHARADERALQVPARAGPDGPLDRLRFPDAHGLRLRLARARSARSACAASRSTRCATWRSSSTDIPLDQVTTSMTINGPAIVLLAFYIALADMRGIPRTAIGGTVQNDCLKEFIAQHAWLVPPRPAMRIVTDMIEFCAQRGAALEHRLDQRLPHPRGRRDGGAGARVHDRRRHRLRRVVPRARPRRRRLRAAALLLLRRAQRLLRGDREVPRRAPHLGAPHEGALRREEGREHEAPHARADRGRLAHRAAAVQQRRARRAPGARGGARRHAVAPHELARRDVRAADRGRA